MKRDLRLKARAGKPCPRPAFGYRTGAGPHGEKSSDGETGCLREEGREGLRGSLPKAPRRPKKFSGIRSCSRYVEFPVLTLRLTTGVMYLALSLKA